MTQDRKMMNSLKKEENDFLGIGKLFSLTEELFWKQRNILMLASCIFRPEYIGVEKMEDLLNRNMQSAFIHCRSASSFSLFGGKWKDLCIV